MKHDRCQVRPAIELRYERLRGIALMDDRGQTFGCGDLELFPKCPLLLYKTRGGAGKVEAGFSDSNGARSIYRLPKFASQQTRELPSELGV